MMDIPIQYNTVRVKSGKEQVVENYEQSTPKRPTPAPSLHWMRHLAGFAEQNSRSTQSSRHWWLARTQAMLIRARTIPQTTEYDRSQRFTECLRLLLSKILASKPTQFSVGARRTTRQQNELCFTQKLVVSFFRSIELIRIHTVLIH